jgi:peptidoglycan/LPS O-acetylase OafA/YrhL
VLTRPAPSGGRVLPQLDALRGVAILAVFVQHLGDRFMPFVDARVAAASLGAATPWILTALHHAWWGVDLFFVLSGFSLAQGYLRAFDRGDPAPSPASFLIRRAARILPAYLVALAVTVATHRGMIAAPGFAASIAAHLALLQGYVTPGGIVIIGATWSLTTEAHFYLLLPAIARPLLAPDPRAPRRRFLVGAAICLLAWASRDLLHRLALEEPGVRTALLEATQRRWITSRLDQFVLGAMAAALHAEILRGPRATLARRLAPGAILIAIAALLVGFRLEGDRFLAPGGSWPYAILSLATAALVLAASLCEGRALAAIAPAPLRAVGVVSYGVFLYHQFVIGVVGYHLPGEGWIVLAENGALALALSLAAGLASWVLIERPAIRWSARASARGVGPLVAPP